MSLITVTTVLDSTQAQAVVTRFPLPEITNKKYALARRHRRFSSQDIAVAQTNAITFQALEWVGDAVIERGLAKAIFRVVQNKNKGQLSRIESFMNGAKSFLRSNHALAALALAYSIHVDVVPSFKNLDPESVAVKKGLGDCFEAYVGALEYNQDNREAEKWLVDVFEFITEIIWSTAEKKVQLEQGVGTFRADLNLLPKITMLGSASTVDASADALAKCNCNRTHLASIVAKMDDVKIEFGEVYRVILPDGTRFEGFGTSRKAAETAAAISTIVHLEGTGTDYHRCVEGRRLNGRKRARPASEEEEEAV